MQFLRVLKQEKSSFLYILVFYVQLKFHAQLLSMKKFYNLRVWSTLSHGDNSLPIAESKKRVIIRG